LNGNGFGSREGKEFFDRVEREVVGGHDLAVARYNAVVEKADVWRQTMYSFINQSLPTNF
jgi:hypothetical protein